MASTTDIKNGAVLIIDGQLWSVVEFQHVKPGKGGAFVRTKLKNVVSGKVVDRTFNAGAKIVTAVVDRRDYQYLYEDGDSYVFMDQDTYDQINVPSTVVGDAKNFLLESAQVTIAMNEGNPLYVEAPDLDRHHDRDRAGPAGRPFLRWHQAGDDRHGLPDPGPALPRERHQGQGRHA